MLSITYKPYSLFKFLFAAVLSLQDYLLSSPATAATSIDENRTANGQKNEQAQASAKAIDDLTREILLKELELERFNIHFRQENSQGRWRGLRYFAWQEANAASSMSGLIVQFYARQSAINHSTISATTSTINVGGSQQQVVTGFVKRPASINVRTLKRSIVPQIVGPFLGLTGSTIELGVNAYRGVQAHKNGLDCRTSLSWISKQQAEVESLLERRERLISSCKDLSERHRQLTLAEGTLLRDMLNMSLNEYVRFYVYIKRFNTTQNGLYLIDIAKNATGAANNIIGVNAAQARSARLALPGGIVNLVSAGLSLANPIVPIGFGKLSEIRSRRATRNIISSDENNTYNKLMADYAAFDRLIKESSSTEISAIDRAFERSEVYEERCRLFTKELQRASRETRAATRIATQNLVSGEIIGCTKLTQAVVDTMCAHRYHNNRRAALPLANGGTIANISGNGLALTDNLRIQIRAELDRARLKKQRQLPSQLLEDRLQSINELEKQLNQQ